MKRRESPKQGTEQPIGALYVITARERDTRIVNTGLGGYQQLVKRVMSRRF
jgi:hypothetical protein